MSVKQGVFLGAAWLAMLVSYQTFAQAPPAKVDVVAVAGSPWTGVLTIVLPIIATCAVTLTGIYFKHRADTRERDHLYAEMAKDRAMAEEARQTIERRIDEDRRRAAVLVDEERAEARRVAQRVEQVAIDSRRTIADAAQKLESVKADLVQTTAVAASAVAETREQLTGLVEAVQAQNVVAQQTGEVLASVHAFLNSGKTMTLKKNAEDAREKSNASGLKVDVDAAELAERDLSDQLAKQLIADTQGGKGQEEGAAGIKAASEALAGANTPKEEMIP